MLTNDAARALGSKLGETRRRQTKLATAVITLVKKAGLTKAGLAWGSAASKAMPLLKKLFPYLAGAGAAGAAGIGSYYLGKGQGAAQPAADGAEYKPYAGKQPVWNQGNKRMFTRMGINPQEMASQTSAMRDVGAGGHMRAQQHKERMNLIRGMYNQ